jgi:hypothetical protein
MSHSESSRRRKLRALRKRGWSEAKIERWLDERNVVAAREERIHPLPPWGDEKSVEAEERLLAKFSDRAWALDFFDHQTALAIIDEAEAAGLVVQPSEFANKAASPEIHKVRVHIPDGSAWWMKLADDSYLRGGRAAVVRDSAQAVRELIQDGLPDDADLVNFYFA